MQASLCICFSVGLLSVGMSILINRARVLFVGNLLLNSLASTCKDACSGYVDAKSVHYALLVTFLPCEISLLVLL